MLLKLQNYWEVKATAFSPSNIRIICLSSKCSERHALYFCHSETHSSLSYWPLTNFSVYHLWKQLWYASLRRAQGEVEGEAGLEPLFSLMDEDEDEDEDEPTASDCGTYKILKQKQQNQITVLE